MKSTQKMKLLILMMMNIFSIALSRHSRKNHDILSDSNQHYVEKPIILNNRWKLNDQEGNLKKKSAGSDLNSYKTISEADHSSNLALSYQNLDYEEELTNWINGFKFNDHKSIFNQTNSGEDPVNIESDISNAEFEDQKFEFRKNLDWPKIKKNFIGKNNDIMKKFLLLRFVDLKKTLLEALSISPFSFCDQDNIPEFTGTLQKFEISCIKYETEDLGKILKSHGKVVFSSAGSTTFTSDIDLNVEFIQHFSDHNHSNSWLLPFRIVGDIIKNYNTIFMEKHGVSSARAFDVNLYSLNFGDKKLLKNIYGLKGYDRYQYKRFLNANRLLALMILFNDAYELAMCKQNEIEEILNIDFEKIREKLIDIYKGSVLKNKDLEAADLKSCGDNIFPHAYEIFFKREHNPSVRNEKMVEHLKINSWVTHIGFNNKIICNILAANYYALEAYIPIGSIVDIMTLQKLIKPQDLKDMSGLVDNDFQLDALIMNFSYGVEHYYEYFGESDSFKKFSKYMGRVLRLSKMLKNLDHKECWKKGFENLLGDTDLGKFWSGKDQKNLDKNQVALAIKTILEKINPEEGANNTNKKQKEITQFFKSGYDCIIKHGLEVEFDPKNLRRRKSSPI
jgi:hypothetical protein